MPLLDVLPRVTYEATDAASVEQSHFGGSHEDFALSVLAHIASNNFHILRLMHRVAGTDPRELAYDDRHTATIGMYHLLMMQTKREAEATRDKGEPLDWSNAQLPKLTTRTIHEARRSNRSLGKSVLPGIVTPLEMTDFRYIQAMIADENPLIGSGLDFWNVETLSGRSKSHPAMPLVVYRALRTQAEIDALNKMMQPGEN